MNVTDFIDDEDRPDIIEGPSIESLITGEATGTEVMDRPADESDVTDRTGYLGGSDAAVIAGLSPWKSPLQLYQERVGLIEQPDLSANSRVYWGNILEEIVAREYAARTGRKVRRVNRLLRHKQYPFLAGHIDRDVLNEPRILECKTADGARVNDWGEEGSSDLPDYYECQVQHYMGVSGAEVCDVAVLIGGNQFRILEVPRDDEFIDALFDLELDFWHRLVKQEPPEPQSADEARQLWRRSHPGEVIATDEAFAAVQRLVEIKATAKALEAEEQDLQLTVMRELGDIGDTLTYRGQKLATWKTQTARRFDSKTFAADHPDLYEDYKRESESRVFRISYKGGSK